MGGWIPNYDLNVGGGKRGPGKGRGIRRARPCEGVVVNDDGTHTPCGHMTKDTKRRCMFHRERRGDHVGPPQLTDPLSAGH
jgi:hypothetical protein